MEPSPAIPQQNELAPQIVAPKQPSSWLELVKFAVIAVIIVVPIRMFVAQPFVVNGASMDPTFATGQYLIIDELTYHFSDPKRGDVIVLHDPRQESRYLIKRVIGLPGETVEISRGSVCVRPQKDAGCQTLSEPFVKYPKTDDTIVQTLAADEYFFMGDNRAQSLDARYLGPTTRDKIVGRVLLRLLPPQAISFFPGSV